MEERLFNKIDEILALIGLILALVLTVWLTLSIQRPIYSLVGVLSSVSCACYLVIRKNSSSSLLPSLVQTEASKRFYLLLNTLFFLLLMYSSLAFCLRPDPYTRPLSYFVSTALMATIVALEILLLPSGSVYNHFALFKVMIVGIYSTLTELLLFPSIVGVDPWWHQMFTVNILKAGHIPGGYDYSGLPILHLMIGSTSLVTGLDYRMSAMLSISIPQVLCNLLFIFLLGKFLFSQKIGLLGSLLLGGANFQLSMSYWAIPNTLAVAFVPAAIYSLFRMRKGRPVASTSLAMIFMGALILTHTVTSAWMAILLSAFWIGFKVYEWKGVRVRCHEPRTAIPILVPFLFLIGTLSWWTYASGHLNTLIELIRWGFSIDKFLGYVPKGGVLYSYNVPFLEQLLNAGGLFAFFAISIIGCLYMVSKDLRSRSGLAIAIGGLTTLIIGFFSMVGRSLIGERWWYFSQIILALPLALGLCLLGTRLRSTFWKSLLLAFLVFSSSLLMLLSPPANLDNSAFSPNTQVRFGFTKSELQAIESLSEMWSKKIGVDLYYSSLSYSSYSVEAIEAELYDGNFSDCKGNMILIREEIVYHTSQFHWGVYKLVYDPRNALATQGFSRVYDCGSVSGFIFP